jgi:hypothetical protein
MKKGGNWEDYRDLITKLRAEGKLKLDRFQEDEMNAIIQRPFHTLEIDEFFFGTNSL